MYLLDRKLFMISPLLF